MEAMKRPSEADLPVVLAFRRVFKVEQQATVRVHVTADERYELYLDGERVGCGPERGDPHHWFFESYELSLTQGEHVLVARAWWFGDEPGRAPSAQMRVQPGFLLAGEGALGEAISTQAAKRGEGDNGEDAVPPDRWQVKRLTGFDIIPPPRTAAEGYAGGMLRIDGGRYDWGFERGGGEGWEAVASVEAATMEEARFGEYARAHRLAAATLPAMMDKSRAIGTVRDAHDLPPGEEAVAGGIPHSGLEHGHAPLVYGPIDPARRDAALVASLQAALRGETPFHLDPHRRIRAILDLDDYVCGYPELSLRGGEGGSVRLHWAESLYLGPRRNGEEHHMHAKGHRDEVDGKYFRGKGDTFILGGGSQPRTFRPLWWRAGRYLELILETRDEAVQLLGGRVSEERYPFDLHAHIELPNESGGDAELIRELLPIMTRGLEASAHETYQDSPYYEQLQYVGDTRLEALATYVLTPDRRLPLKAVRMYDASLRPDGLTQSRYPCSAWHAQCIPGFSLWWVGMVHDAAAWGAEKGFIQDRMPGVRAVLEAFRARLNSDSLLEPMPGWRYLDWVPQWTRGIPPGGEAEPAAAAQWQLAWALSIKAELERWLGEAALAERDQADARRVAAAAEAYWREEEGAYAENAEATLFSEHAQCLAVLSGLLPQERREAVANAIATGTAGDQPLIPMTIYFSHYFFEACRILHRMEPLFDRLRGTWGELVKLGLKTPLEKPEPSRSDCHAWSSHPLFHLHATLLGVRPTCFGMTDLTITPQLGPLPTLAGRLPLPHPLSGEIVSNWRQENGHLSGSITLPQGVHATLRINREEHELGAGTHHFHPGSR